MDADNFADAWEAIAASRPGERAIVHDGQSTTWADFDARASALTATLTGEGLAPGDPVAQYLHSGPEYLESVFASFKARLVPVNTNYRYVDDELVYLWNNAEAAAVIFDVAFIEMVERIRDRVASVRCWICVASSQHPAPSWAIDYGEAVDRSPAGTSTSARSGDDLYLLYTGGTTGLPRGVMWRQRDLMGYVMSTSPTAPERHPEVARQQGWVHLSASPLMHGTGSFTAFQALCAGGCVATLAGRSFDAAELLDVVDRERVATIALVGDAFCRPILAALDSEPERWSLSSVRWIVSSGAIWSADAKTALLARNPHLTLIDSLASSEAPGMASAIATTERPPETGVFTAGAATLLLDDHDAPIPASTGVPGRVAVAGYLPVGYHGDPEKTAATFIERDGVRYSVPGDWATLDPDGTLHLLGRGASVINTGGEKVFAEEVEDVLRTHEDVADAVVVGVPDLRLGERVVAMVAPAADSRPVSDDLAAHVRSHLAGYKVPRRVTVVEEIRRGPTGKVDYAWARETALAAGRAEAGTERAGRSTAP